MKPEYRITFAIASILILTALIFPPWKNSYSGQFSGFHYLFSNAELVKMLELDYARLGIITLGIILISVTVHLLFILLPTVPFFKNSQHFVMSVQSSVKKPANAIANNYIIIKAILILFIAVGSGYGINNYKKSVLIPYPVSIPTNWKKLHENTTRILYFEPSVLSPDVRDWARKGDPVTIWLLEDLKHRSKNSIHSIAYNFEYECETNSAYLFRIYPHNGSMASGKITKERNDKLSELSNFSKLYVVASGLRRIDGVKFGSAIDSLFNAICQ